MKIHFEAVVKSGNTTQIQILRFILLLLEFTRSLRSAGRDPKSASVGPGTNSVGEANAKADKVIAAAKRDYC